MGKAGKITLAIAAVGGFVAGILLAPKSGKETREEIKAKANAKKAEAHDKFDQVKDAAKRTGKQVEDLADDAKDRAAKIADDAKKTAENLKK